MGRNQCEEGGAAEGLRTAGEYVPSFEKERTHKEEALGAGSTVGSLEQATHKKASVHLGLGPP